VARLASRSPAAPFQSSRPAPVKPQRPPQSTTNTEAQTLRQMVQEREEKIRELEEEVKRLRKGIKTIKERLRYVDQRMHPADWGSHDVESSFCLALADCDYALDGGGDDHASS